MQIERFASPLENLSGRAFCPLECTDCSGICLALYMMLTPAERSAVWNKDGTVRRVN